MAQGTDFIRQVPDWMPVSRDSMLQRMHIDGILLFLLLMLAGFGLLVLYSASSGSIEEVSTQAVYMALGFLVMVVIAQVDAATLRWFAPWAYAVGVILLVAVALFGTGAKGAQRWLDLPGLPRFQPSELLKLALPVTLAAYFHERAFPPKFRHIVWSLVIMGIPMVLIMRQPDLGTAMLIAASGITVLFMAGLQWRYIIGVAVSVAALAPVMWFHVLHDYQKKRIITLLDPEADKLGAGWNIIQSTTAIGAGGFDGKGWLHGTQSHLDFLPESHTDFIIAVLAEEFGYIGVMCLLGLFCLIVLRGLWISWHAQETFGKLLAGTITVTFFVYVFVNMGMVSGILPVVGVPLPLVSRGGTAIVTLMAGFGMLMAIATEHKRLAF